MIGTKPLPATGSRELMAALATGIRCVYQPIVRLADRRVIAYKALARGPAGSRLERPDVIKLDLGLLHNSPSREIAEPRACAASTSAPTRHCGASGT
ncbi:MAG TPA: hypothetical protein VJS15_03580 [Allosphingosinicella sp.]|nr:hypothetical protein [Allosphingosinicella sp.]